MSDYDNGHDDDCACQECVVTKWPHQKCRRHPECSHGRNHYGWCEKVIPLQPFPGTTSPKPEE